MLTTVDALEYGLSDADRAALREAARSSADGASLERLLPSGLSRFLQDFRTGRGTAGYAVISGVELGELPPTPSDYTVGILLDHETTGTMRVIAECLGGLVGYADEKGGSFIHEVHPVRGEEDHIENTGSVAFDFHTENVHHPLRPDFLGLLCLRQDHERVAATRVSSVRHAVSHLEPWQLAALREARFESLYPTSFVRGQSGPRPSTNPHPVVFGPESQPLMRYNSHNTRAMDEEGGTALKALSEALEAVCHNLVLRPGDLVIVDNHVAAHGRSAFVPRYDGRDRWLRRFYAIEATPRWARGMMVRPRVLPPVPNVLGVF
ncbi:TauD/TfdA family dioxygenase [Streptosporangium algeriense]|uniref:TauD/TfdA family dioxygenase n=1 Tax=Streptosporangium algeriense TaxID=1682748 RepID=A0ABW3DN48_9ACTN